MEMSSASTVIPEINHRTPDLISEEDGPNCKEVEALCLAFLAANGSVGLSGPPTVSPFMAPTVSSVPDSRPAVWSPDPLDYPPLPGLAVAKNAPTLDEQPPYNSSRPDNINTNPVADRFALSMKKRVISTALKRLRQTPVPIVSHDSPILVVPSVNPEVAETSQPKVPTPVACCTPIKPNAASVESAPARPFHFEVTIPVSNKYGCLKQERQKKRRNTVDATTIKNGKQTKAAQHKKIGQAKTEKTSNAQDLPTVPQDGTSAQGSKGSEVSRFISIFIS